MPIVHLRQTDINFEQFKRLLKTFLFGCWDHGALWPTVTLRLLSHLTYLLRPYLSLQTPLAYAFPVMGHWGTCPAPSIPTAFFRSPQSRTKTPCGCLSSKKAVYLSHEFHNRPPLFCVSPLGYFILVSHVPPPHTHTKSRRRHCPQLIESLQQVHSTDNIVRHKTMSYRRLTTDPHHPNVSTVKMLYSLCCDLLSDKSTTSQSSRVWATL